MNAKDAKKLSNIQSIKLTEKQIKILESKIKTAAKQGAFEIYKVYPTYKNIDKDYMTKHFKLLGFKIEFNNIELKNYNETKCLIKW